MTRREVVAAYQAARRTALSTPTVRLRWQARRLGRHREVLDQLPLARLKALCDELTVRGAR